MSAEELDGQPVFPSVNEGDLTLFHVPFQRSHASEQRQKTL